MNALAPLVVGIARYQGIGCSRRQWPLATVLQLVLLWMWHAPPAFDAAMGDPTVMGAMHLSLLASACWFWLSVFSVDDEHRWQAIAAILVTGKLFCLLGALIAFSPRALYQVACVSDACRAAPAAFGLADQQMAGSMMLIACPLSYVLIGTVVAARWLMRLEQKAGEYG